MDTANSSLRFIEGLRNIELAIIHGVRSGGLDIAAKNFTWHRGKALLPQPSVVRLELRIGVNTVTDTFSREEVEDAWQRVDRPDTQRKIQQIIAATRK